MSLSIGARVGVYEILAPLGAGGMGEVYRARDTMLGRNVAIKILPDAFSNDSERVARFEREARTLAALNHPHIAQIYGFERFSMPGVERVGLAGLVMELVEGEDLAERVARGPIAIDDALLLARQIAQALEAAHAQGIIHRDLKPANIKVRADHTVKVLDFGLAKALTPSSASLGDANAERNFTVTAPGALTRGHVVLGTAAYMAPEQAKGRPADKRADLWAFGCVVFEMLTGRRAFAGDDVSEVLAAVMRDAPRFDALPAAVPDPIRRLLRRCLEKNPDKRLDSMAVARLEIDEASATPHATIDVPAGAASAVAARRGTRLPVSLRAVLAGVLVIGVGVGGYWIGRRTTNASASLTPTSLEMGLAPAESLGPLALFARPSRPSFVVTRDGGRVVFAGATKDSTQLFVRAFNTTDAVAIDGTKGAQTPFLSPDDKWVGFLADGVLRKIPLAGGPVSSVADLTAAQAGGSTLVPSAVNLFGASWGDDGMIVFGRYSDGLWQVPAAGGTPSRLTAIDSSPDAASHRLPHHLPEGRGLLLTVASAPPRVAVLPNGSKEPRVLIESATDGRYIASGHIAFTRDGLLMAVPFDLDRLIVTGPAIALVENVLEASGSGSPGANTGAAQFDVSSSGTLVYASGGTFPLEPSRLVWVDRLGRLEPIDAPVGSYIRPRLSSDGRRLVVTYRPQGPRDPSGIAVFDFDRKALRRLTAKGEWGPLWSSDGAEVFFKQTDGIGRTRVDGSVPAERIHTHHGAYPHSVSADGSSLVFQTIDAETGSDLWLMSLRPDRTTRPLLRTPANESWGEISPDGRWLAYGSDSSGRSEVYVQPLEGAGRREQISVDGGHSPLWARNRRELFFMAGAGDKGVGDRILAAEVTVGATFSARQPRELFVGRFVTTGGPTGYDITPDGQRFLMVEELDPPKQPTTRLRVVLNWFQEVTRAQQLTK